MQSATMALMRHALRLSVPAGGLLLLGSMLAAQAVTGAIDMTARVTPTGARPEPVRQFTFYVLTKSYAEIIKEVEGQDVLPTREEFIDKLTVSPELKKWMKAHNVMDLTSPDLDKVVTADDIIEVPEFFEAYERTNSGGVTMGIPKPKYHETDKTANPEKYQKQKDEFYAATKKFIHTYPATVQGMEMELAGVNPNVQWEKLHVDHKKRIAQMAPDTAQVKYLAGKADTDLDGHAVVGGLAPGKYWISSLGMDAASGDRRLLWDVAITVEAGQTSQLNLSNINATDARALQP
jgi:hypothetical protein